MRKGENNKYSISNSNWEHNKHPKLVDSEEIDKILLRLNKKSIACFKTDKNYPALESLESNHNFEKIRKKLTVYWFWEKGK